MEQPEEGGFLNSYDPPRCSGPFTIRDSISSVDDKGAERPQFAFTFLTPDSMEGSCCKDGSAYMLYR